MVGCHLTQNQRKMMPRCCMDAWAVVMSDQAIKQAKPHTHARSGSTLERDSRPCSHCTILSMITSASPRVAIESASSVYCRKYRSGWRLGCAVRHFGHGDGRDRVQTTLSIPCARLGPWGWRLKMWGCRPPEHTVSVKPNTTQQDKIRVAGPVMRTPAAGRHGFLSSGE